MNKKQKTVPSSNTLFNEAGENTLARTKKDPHTEIWHMNVKVGQTMHKATAVKIPSTGWLLITIDADS